jgi:hypothetical protein
MSKTAATIVGLSRCRVGRCIPVALPHGRGSTIVGFIVVAPYSIGEPHSDAY